MPGMRLRLGLFLLAGLLDAAELRLGIVGTDTSHAVAFTQLLNEASTPGHLTGARVVAAYKGGSPDIAESRDRVDKLASELATRYGVEIVPDIATLVGKVDAIFLESVDGRPHLAQFREIVKAMGATKKPVFIDKPLASTLADAEAIAALAEASGVRWFSSSALRFSDGLKPFRAAGLQSLIAWGPGPLEEHHQLELSWYGIHTVEVAFSILGPGAESVSWTATPDGDALVARWSRGRLATLHLKRPYSDFGAAGLVASTDRVLQNEANLYEGYRGLVVAILEFFQGGKAPVDPQETLEMFRFMEAAQRSKAGGGLPMAVAGRRK